MYFVLYDSLFVKMCLIIYFLNTFVQFLNAIDAC